MWNEPAKERLEKMPGLYDTEGTPFKDKLVYLHFFIGSSDWYAAEYDGNDTFFGFVILNSDIQMAEWGYFSFSELKSLKVNGWFEVDSEKEEFWDVRKASEVDRIREANGWKKEKDNLKPETEEVF